MPGSCREGRDRENKWHALVAILMAATFCMYVQAATESADSCCRQDRYWHVVLVTVYKCRLRGKKYCSRGLSLFLIHWYSPVNVCSTLKHGDALSDKRCCIIQSFSLLSLALLFPFLVYYLAPSTPARDKHFLESNPCTNPTHCRTIWNSLVTNFSCTCVAVQGLQRYE